MGPAARKYHSPARLDRRIVGEPEPRGQAAAALIDNFPAYVVLPSIDDGKHGRV